MSFVNCTLNVYGRIAKGDLTRMCDFIASMDGKIQNHEGDRNEKHEGNGLLSRDFQAEFFDVKYGEMDDKMNEWLATRELSYSWHFEGGDGFPSGVAVYDSPSNKRAEWATVDGDIALTFGLLKEQFRFQQARENNHLIKNGRLCITDDDTDLRASHTDLLAALIEAEAGLYSSDPVRESTGRMITKAIETAEKLEARDD